ncbi:unnamed protein product [Dicrocoelium dendriticum]|nr:unnamed protein product [Dicrocoelium dendriticum]
MDKTVIQPRVSDILRTQIQNHQNMLTAILLCFVQSFLGISCDFVSITVAGEVDLSNQTIGASVEANCGTQRSKFGHNLVGPCSLYRWFYEPRIFELTCVCEAHDEEFANGTLLQKMDKSFGIPSIDRVRFAAGADVKQGCFVYELKIRTLSDPVQTALGLVSRTLPNVGYPYEVA